MLRVWVSHRQQQVVVVVILPVEMKECIAIAHWDTHIIGLVDDHSVAKPNSEQLYVLMISPSPVGMQDTQRVICKCSTEEILRCEITNERRIKAKHVRL